MRWAHCAGLLMFCSFAQGQEYLQLDFPSAVATMLLAIDREGDVVGEFRIRTGRRYGFLLNTEGVFRTIDVGGSIDTRPSGINLHGSVAGSYQDGDGQQHGFLLQRGEFTTIDLP